MKKPTNVHTPINKALAMARRRKFAGSSFKHGAIPVKRAAHHSKRYNASA